MNEASRDTIVDIVKERYGAIAEGRPPAPAAADRRGNCSPSASATTPRTSRPLPDEANLGLGCGAPSSHLALQPGETVVDLGSGAGLDAFLAARAVGPEGKVIGVDMTPAMLKKARAERRAGRVCTGRIPRGPPRRRSRSPMPASMR